MLQYKAVHKTDEKIAYLGDEYSYSHEAARRCTELPICAYGSMSEVIDAVGTECSGAVMPLENNVEGAVGEALDALAERRLKISAELVLPIVHSLIAEDGVKLSDVRQIVSHAQAIGQCRKFLSEFDCKIMAAPSTSAALLRVGGDTAAIAYKPRRGQYAVKTHIQDSVLNATRFALVTRDMRRDGGTVSVRFDVANAPGELAHVLDYLYECGVNLTRILSRPHRSGNGEYRFFADFDFTRDNAALDGLLDRMKEYCRELDLLGRYDIHKA